MLFAMLFLFSLRWVALSSIESGCDVRKVEKDEISSKWYSLGETWRQKKGQKRNL